jgi:hypothetical protein
MISSEASGIWKGFVENLDFYVDLTLSDPGRFDIDPIYVT